MFNRMPSLVLALLLPLNVSVAQELPTQAQPTLTADGLASAHQGVLDTAGDFLKAGATELSLQFLQENPPKTAEIDTWKAWAEQKWNIMVQLKDWHRLKQDAKGLPASFGAAKEFSLVYQAKAMIALGEFVAARTLLQDAIANGKLSTKTEQNIRREMIALYQAQGDHTNAKIEAIRFHDEFKPQSADWYIQRSVIEHLAGDTVGGARLLAAVSSIQAKLLLSFYRFTANEITQTQALQAIGKQQQRKRIKAAEKKLAFGLIANIAGNANQESQVKQTAALEQYLEIDRPDLFPSIAAFDSENLKTAYLLMTDSLVNEVQLDPKRMNQWFTLAQQKQSDGLTIASRSLYAALALSEDDEKLALAAKNEIVNNLIEANKYSLLVTLFGTQNTLGDFSNMESSASAKLLNHALKAGDANLIASIAPFLGAAPENIDSRDWLLQKSRIDIFSGRFEHASEKIEAWLATTEKLAGEDVDRVLQAVFDLQAVHQNDLSLKLLDLVSLQTNSARHKREILFWKAQSFEAKGERSRAAQFYLRSALAKENGYDQWGQSARYHAASNLMESGAYADSKALFQGLLSATNDASRRGTIKQALQRLWLLEHKVEID